MSKIIRMNAFIRYFLSYIAVLAVILTISITVYTIAEEDLKNQLSLNNMSALRKSQVFVEERLKSIELVTSEIALSPRVQSFLRVRDTDDASNIYAAYEITKDLSRYCSINSYFSSIYLCFDSSDMVIGSNGTYSSEFFFNEMLNYNHREDMKKAMQKPSNGRFLTVDDTSGRKTKAFILTLPLWDNSQVLGSVLIFIDEEQILGLGGETAESPGEYSVVLDETGSVIADTGNSDKYSNIIEEIHENWEKNETSGQIYFDSYLASYSVSKYHKWFFISLTSTDVAFNKLYSLRYIGIMASVAAIILGIILSAGLARMNYLPIKRIIKKFKETDFNKEGVSDLGYLEEAISETLKQYNSVSRIVEVQVPLIKDSVLQQLLHAGFTDNDRMEACSRKNGIHFSAENYVVMMVELDECGGFIRKEHSEDYVLAQFVIANIFEEILTSVGNVYSTMLDKTVRCFLLNIDSTLESEKEALVQKLSEGLKVIRDEFDIHPYIGISDSCSEIEDISLLRQEADQAREYLIFHRKASIQFFDELCKLQSNYFYPQDTQIKLSNTIKTGNTVQALEILKSIHDLNTQDRNLSVNGFKCLYFGILNTVFQAMSELNMAAEAAGFYFGKVSAIVECTFIDQLHETIAGAVTGLCHEVNKNKKSRNEALKEDILTYIHQHYTDNGISLERIANAIHINASYLSAYFKEQMGTNLSEYINQLRLEKVKQQLLGTDLPLNVIAENVGYTNSSILIRTFRKMEGVTPGQFRETGSHERAKSQGLQKIEDPDKKSVI